MIARLSFAALLVLSAPAVAQETGAPPVAVAAPSAPDPEAAGLTEAATRVEAAGRALETAIAELTPRLAEVQADPSAPDAVKATRGLNLMAGLQLEIDALADAVHDLVLEQMLAQGTAREEAESLAATVRSQVSTSVVAGLASQAGGD